MQKPDLGQTIAILANVGVIAGIIFLGFELHQNNQSLQAQARYNQHEVLSRMFMIGAENPNGLLELWDKGNNGEPLSWVESTPLFLYAQAVLRDFEWTFLEVRAGRLEVRALDSPAWAGAFENIPRLREVYELRRGSSHPDWAQFMDENVLPKVVE